jgi:hypothetical protein
VSLADTWGVYVGRQSTAGDVVVTVIYTKRATTCAISKWGMTTQDVYELVLNSFNVELGREAAKGPLAASR